MATERPAILLIDDDENDRMFCRRALVKAGIGWSVVEIGSADEALSDLAGRADPARELGLILLDVHMPLLSGLEILSMIKDDPRAASVPIVMLSGSDDPSEDLRARELGAAGWLVKPPRPRALQALFLQLGLEA